MMSNQEAAFCSASLKGGNRQKSGGFIEVLCMGWFGNSRRGTSLRGNKVQRTHLNP